MEKAARRPLSVSSDRIAVTAMRCATIITLMEDRGAPVDRSGSGSVCEVYPAAALVRWGIDPTGYKTGEKAKAARKRILDALAEGSGGWFTATPETCALCVRSDDALDAMVCAFIARAAGLGLTTPAPASAQSAAQREGWIHLPTKGSFPQLAGPD